MADRFRQDLWVGRAALEELESAWRVIEEYYEAAGVVARDSKEDFGRYYFGDGAGVWLARNKESVAGCIALRKQTRIAKSGEVKRLYVAEAFRGLGIAGDLYAALENYARQFGYEWLYLDTTDEMTKAQNFYAKLGYRPCSRYNDNPQATIFMRKTLI